MALALVLMFVTARANGEKEQQMQANCLESGGIYILDTGCIIPTERREFWLNILLGVAVVAVILGVVAGGVLWAIANGKRSAGVIESCHASGGTWASLNGASACLHTTEVPQ